jgi:hypothetical protein
LGSLPPPPPARAGTGHFAAATLITGHLVLGARVGEAWSAPVESAVVLESLCLPPPAGMVKIVTYNVNGLRPRVAQHGSLRRLLDSLDADIICFQVRSIADPLLPTTKLIRPICHLGYHMSEP